MKVHVEIDCTPEEARRFFGLPDLSPVHEAYAARLAHFVEDGLPAGDMERMIEQWTRGIGNAGGSFADLQKAMLAAMSGARDGER